MSKVKWQQLPLRLRVLLISSILLMLSIPLSLITLYSIAISITFWAVSVFYNLYKFMQMANISIPEAIETDTKKGLQELKERKKISGTVRIIALPFAFCIGIPTAIVVLVCLWMSI